MTELQQDTTSADISAGTASAKVGGHLVRVSLPKTGDEEPDDETDVRRRQLEEKARLTSPENPIRQVPSTNPTTPGDPMAKYDAQQLRQMLARGHAMRNAKGEPSYPIADEEDLRKAIRAVGRGGREHDTVRKHIIRRARALSKSAMIPDTWSADGSVQQEEPKPSELAAVLLLEGTVPSAVVLQEATPDNGGVMRLRVPFYVGESIANAPGFSKKIYFPKSLLPAVVQEGRQQIADGKQPLTVYARHAHAMSGDHLPVGAVVDLEQEGRFGYATLEISPTTTGRDVQVLAQNKHLNAVSLRSGLGRFELEERVVNGDPMLTPTRLGLSGIDCAPDGPAQPTYGMEILQEDARVELLTTPKSPPKRRTPPVPDAELTLDTLRAEYPEIVSEIEAPLQRELNKVTSERNVLMAERDARLRDEKLRDIASKFPDPDKALPKLQELCAECKTDAEVAERAFPILLEALERSRSTEAPAVEKPAKEVLLEMFRPGGAGQAALNQETHNTETNLDPAAFVGVDVAEV